MFCLFSYLLVYALIVLYIYSQKNASLEQAYSELADSRSNFDDYCQIHGEWEQVDNVYYFKKSAAFYFLDAGFFRLNLIKSSRATPVLFYFHLKITMPGHFELTHKIESSQIESRWRVPNYELVFVEAKFDLSAFLTENSAQYESESQLVLNTSIEITIQIEQVKRQAVMSKNSIGAKIKFLFKSHVKKPKYAMVCTKCLYTHQKDINSIKLEWWLEVNKAAGYANIALCNQSISGHSNYRELFDRNKEYLLISQLKCVPNLLDKTAETDYR